MRSLESMKEDLLMKANYISVRPHIFSDDYTNIYKDVLALVEQATIKLPFIIPSRIPSLVRTQGYNREVISYPVPPPSRLIFKSGYGLEALSVSIDIRHAVIRHINYHDDMLVSRDTRTVTSTYSGVRSYMLYMMANKLE
jgi:hypothetical protein